MNTRLKQAREILGISQGAVARSNDLSVSYVSLMEAGKRNITPSLIKFFVDYGISKDWLMNGKGEILDGPYSNSRFTKDFTKLTQFERAKLQKYMNTLKEGG